ncbi:hypothetical protein [Shewanella glacialipiscicola]|uniref:hypothetical protein n=1 Tax=Shewanella glacialipiscicola TaxID=614069 RepID=UPI003D7B58BC
MRTTEFIDNKAPQLAFYGKAFLNGELDFQEIQLYLWDTLEEWQQLNSTGEAQSEMEKVFWHLLHSFNQWPDYVIRGNQYLRKQVNDCCDYLSLGGRVPQGCVGIRP